MHTTWKHTWIYFFILFLFNAYNLSAQKVAEGYIKDSAGDKVVGATIYVKGSTLGTHSDQTGYFQLEIPQRDAEQDTLVASFALMKKEIILEETHTTLSISLEDLTILPVEILGYSSRSNCHGGCWGHCNISKLNMLSRIVNTPTQISDGLILRPYASTIGVGPLYIVDGIPIRSFTNPPTNPLDFLAPEDIESISFLRGVTAVSWGGEAGRDGVIVITTKSKTAKKDETKLTYSGLWGAAQIQLNNSYRTALAQQQHLSFKKSRRNYSFYGSGSLRDYPGFKQGASSRHIGVHVAASKKNLLDYKLKIGGRIAYNRISQDIPNPIVSKKKSYKSEQMIRATYHNYFSQAFAEFKLSDAIKSRLDLSRLESENLNFRRLGGNFFKPSLELDKKLGKMHRIRGNIGLERQDLSSDEMQTLHRNAQSLSFTHSYGQDLEIDLAYRQEQNRAGESNTPLNSRYASTGIKLKNKEIAEIDLEFAGKCAYSRMEIRELYGKAGISQTPFMDRVDVEVGTRILFDNLGILSASYIHSESTANENSLSMSPENLLYFPELYRQLENQGFELSMDTQFNLGGTSWVKLYTAYNKGNGLAREMFLLRPQIEWKSIGINGSFEGIKGWKLSGGDQDFFRMAFLDINIDLKDIPALSIKNLKLSLTSQNLFTSGDQGVWEDRVELSRLRDPLQFPVPLAKNLLLGIKMDIL